ncbi:MAG: hypothetical protein ACJAZD_001188, partial [Ilumatobacter sp.]
GEIVDDGEIAAHDGEFVDEATADDAAADDAR